MPISEKQLIANRKNALKSTGPKTAYGKLRSSRNAYKHGLYSKCNLEEAIEPLSPVQQYLFIKSLLDQIERGMTGKNKYRNPFITPRGINP